jgi:outer membrane biosynthesis protein TonB
MPPSIQIARSRISQASGAGNTNSPVGWIVAIALHVAIGAAALLSFSHQIDTAAVDETPVVPVDLVTLGAKTNVMAMTKEPKAPPKDVPVPVTPQAIPKPTPAPTQPQVAEVAPPKPAEAAPAENIPKPQAKPKPVQPDKQKTQDQQLAALLDKYSAPAASPKNARVGPQTTRGVGAMNAMTADLQTSLANQIYKCWSPPVGAPKAEDLVVDFDLFLNRDGSVAQPPQLAAEFQAAAAANPYTRAAAEAARRAIYTCAPYKLPPDRYDQWREISPFHFDPRLMMGQ